MIEVGSTVGNYQIKGKIGAGAMGTIFLAEHPELGKRVAIKAMHSELAIDEELLGRFFDEARAVGQIGHPHIVTVHDFGRTAAGDSFIVMELLDGQTLGALLEREGHLKERRALHIVAQLADALAAAHEQGILHRDLKPDNVILVEQEGDRDFVKLLDFGLAKLTLPTHPRRYQTKTGALLGTPHYMAPEQVDDARSIDARAEVYALGCILFQLLTGRVPFPGSSFAEVLVGHLRSAPPIPSRLNPAVSPAVDALVLRMLAKKPKFRFDTMRELAAALRSPKAAAASLRKANGAGLAGVGGQALSTSRPVVRSLYAAARTYARSVRRAEIGGWLPLAFGAVTVLLVATVVAAWYGGALSLGSLGVKVTSEPAGALVYEGAHLLGRTPLDFTLPRTSEPHSLVIMKSGFEPSRRLLAPSGDQELKVRLMARHTLERALEHAFDPRLPLLPPVPQ